MEIEINYGCGYARHKETIEVEEDATEEEIERYVQDMVMEKLDWNWNRASK